MSYQYKGGRWIGCGWDYVNRGGTGLEASGGAGARHDGELTEDLREYYNEAMPSFVLVLMVPGTPRRRGLRRDLLGAPHTPIPFPIRSTCRPGGRRIVESRGEESSVRNSRRARYEYPG